MGYYTAHSLSIARAYTNIVTSPFDTHTNRYHERWSPSPSSLLSSACSSRVPPWQPPRPASASRSPSHACSQITSRTSRRAASATHTSSTLSASPSRASSPTASGWTSWPPRPSSAAPSCQLAKSFSPSSRQPRRRPPERSSKHSAAGRHTSEQPLWLRQQHSDPRSEEELSMVHLEDRRREDSNGRRDRLQSRSTSTSAIVINDFPFRSSSCVQFPSIVHCLMSLYPSKQGIYCNAPSPCK